MTLVAGVDSSTQSCKVVIRDAATGALVRTGRAAHPDGTEVDPDAWWRALSEAIADAGGLDDVRRWRSAASSTAWWCSMPTAASSGPPCSGTTPARRQAAAALIAEFGADDFAARTGLVPVASFTVTKLRWLRDAEPENAARVAAVALPHDWLTWRLRGFGPAGSSPLGPVLEELTTDRSDASGTGYWSPSTGEYDRELFSGARARRRSTRRAQVLPRVLGPGDAAGEIHPGARLRGSAPASLAQARQDRPEPGGIQPGRIRAPDPARRRRRRQRRRRARPRREPGDVVVSIGTSGTVFAVASRPDADPSGTVAGFADASGDFLPIAATLNAARVLDSVAGLLGVDYDELSRLALEAEPGAGGVVLVPYFEGERTPNLPDATASFDGLTLASSTRSNLARAAIEGMLCGLADGLDAVRAQGGPATRVLLIGGAAQNPAVQTIAAQVFDLPVVVPSPGEYVARGAAVQAAWALSGSRPEWSVAVNAAPAPDFQPIIRQNYQRASSQIDPGS